MNKFSKFKFYIIFLFFGLFFAAPFFYQTQLPTAGATSQKSYYYTINNNNDNYSILGSNIDQSQYLIADNLSSFDNVFNLISNDLETDNKSLLNTEITVYFNDLHLKNNQIIFLSKGLINLTGEISSESQNHIFKICAEDVNNFEFKNITINSSNTEIVKIISSKTQTNITLNNSYFKSSLQNSYALSFDETVCNLTLKNTNQHSTQYLLNYNTNIHINIDESFISSNLRLTLPYNIYNHAVLTNIDSNILSSFSFYPEAENTYYIQGLKDGNNYICSSIIKLNHNTNNASTSNGTFNSFYYGNTLNLTTNISKHNNIFSGWYGTCIIDSINYYFDKNLLSLAINNFNSSNEDIETIAKHTFKTSLNDVNEPFIVLFDQQKQQETYNLIKFFVMINQTPNIIARWDYELTLILNNEIPNQKAYISIDSNANLSTPEKEGYTFIGWFLDENLTNPCNFNEIRNNICIYAKWQINEYEITFVSNDDFESIITKSFTFNNKITYPEFSKTGYFISNWKTDQNDIFSQNSTMPAKNITLYAQWEPLTFVTYYNTLNETTIPHTYSKFGESQLMPSINLTKNGYSFNGWFDKETNLPFDFSNTPARNRTAVAQWIPNRHTATLMLETQETINVNFDETISYIPVKKGFKFLGWFYNSTDKFTTMPDEDIVLFPHWQQKSTLSLSLNQQKRQITESNIGFKFNSSITGFKVEYFINNAWTTEKPTSIGEYDVKIIRAEDDNYAEFEQVISKGYQILPKEYNLQPIIAILFAIFFLEIITIIIIKSIKSKKKNSIINYTIVLPFAMFDKTLFIVAIIAMLLVIFGFIWLIRELVVLHYTLPNNTVDNKYDNRVTIEKIEDASNDIDIENKVEDLLLKNNLIKEKKKQTKIKVNNDDNDNSEHLDLFDDNK